MNPREKAARALAANWSGPAADESNWKLWLPDVEVVLRAIREPSPEMVEAAWRTTRGVSAEDRMTLELGDPKAAHAVKAKQRFQAMIDSLLEGK